MLNEQLKADFEELFSGNNEWIESLNGQCILITGSTGLIGSVIGRAVLFYNEFFNGRIKLICHARNKAKAETLYRDWLDSEWLSFCIGGIDHALSYPGEVDYIIHCANTTSSKDYVEKPAETIHTIVSGTENVLRFALEKKTKCTVYLSSMEIYGSPDPDRSVITETDSGYINTMNVRSSYSEGKRLAECLCASFSSEYGIKTVVARSAQVFGAGVDINDNRVFMQLAKSAIKHKDFVMHSDGSSYGNYCYTTDAVKALLMLLNKGRSGEAYNIVNENNTMTIREMAETVANHAADTPFDIVYDIPVSDKEYGYAPKVVMRLSAGKMKELGWEARIDMREMYKRLINYLTIDKDL